MNKEKVMISVIMPTYNTPIKMLSQAIESILNQTYTNFEFIIINDCSTDNTLEYLFKSKLYSNCISIKLPSNIDLKSFNDSNSSINLKIVLFSPMLLRAIIYTSIKNSPS